MTLANAEDLAVTDLGSVDLEKKKKKKKKKKMPIDKRRLIAFQRFGLGARPDTFRLKDPKKSLVSELSAKNVALVPKTSLLPTYKQACAIGEGAPTDLANLGNYPSETIKRRELDARFRKHLQAKIGFVERLVMFWSNHFTVNANKEVTVVTRSTVGQLERDVIRKHALGKFPDMLVAVMKHPAMICYLDNHISVGPNSESAKEGNVFNDINVNLAREIHELHTVGSGGGYTEADITALALMLSGWSYVTMSESAGFNGGTKDNVGQFIYKPRWHEPASVRPTFKHMGVTRANSGAAVGEQVLRWLAMRPATAQHLAYKMLAHFISDTPSKKDVAALSKVYLKTGGDLRKMARAMLDLKSAWRLPLKKFRTPYEAVTAQYRAMRTMHTAYAVDGGGSDLSNYQTNRWNMAFMNQLPFECLDPDGWGDDSAEWLNSDALRVGVAAAYEAVTSYAPASVKGPGAKVHALGSKAGVLSLARALFGKELSSATAKAISGAPDADRALTILFVSPEFLRR